MEGGSLLSCLLSVCLSASPHSNKAWTPLQGVGHFGEGQGHGRNNYCALFNLSVVSQRKNPSRHRAETVAVVVATAQGNLLPDESSR